MQDRKQVCIQILDGCQAVSRFDECHKYFLNRVVRIRLGRKHAVRRSVQSRPNHVQQFAERIFVTRCKCELQVIDRA